MNEVIETVMFIVVLLVCAVRVIVALLVTAVIAWLLFSLNDALFMALERLCL